MVLVGVAAEHGAVGADRDLACLTVVIHLVVVLLADLHSIFDKSSVGQALSLRRRVALVFVQNFYLLCDFLDKTVAANQLVDLEAAATVWALLPLLDDPLSDATSAGQFAAAWTNDRVFNFAEANETLEEFVNILVGGPVISSMRLQTLLDCSPRICALYGACVVEP